jgi:hypothetical protein
VITNLAQTKQQDEDWKLDQEWIDEGFDVWPTIVVIPQDSSCSEEPIEDLLRLGFDLGIMLSSGREMMKHRAHRLVDFSFFETELQLHELYRLRRESDQFSSIQNRVLVAPQECRLKDGLEAVCRELRTFLLISPNQFIELAPVVPRPQLQEANQPIGIGKRVDDWCAGKMADQMGTKTQIRHKAHPVKHQR